MSENTPPTRLHALDNLRALMMWLGIVLHAGAIYMAGELILPWRDPAQTRIADFLAALIHAFRMPVFFIVAGFFAAMLLQRLGPRAFARHRLRRLGLPFVVFWPVLLVASGLLILAFLHQMARGTWGIDESLIPPNHPAMRKGSPNTMHLWFLWMLLWFCLATAALARWTRVWQPAAAELQSLGMRWWGALALAFPLAICGLGYPHGLLRPYGHFLPPLAEWVHNGLFYAFGLALFHRRDEMLAAFRARWRRFAWAGAVAFFISGALYERRAADLAFAYAYNVCSWLWSFAILGAAQELLSRRNAVLAYLAESSYWVYLVHLPLTILFGLLLYTAPLPALAKLLANIAATTAVCLASYQLFVRRTLIGVLLNGRRVPRPVSAEMESARQGL